MAIAPNLHVELKMEKAEKREGTIEKGAMLLTAQELATRLNVPASWIREKTRNRARVRDEDPLPVVRLGKYTRFSWQAIEAWLDRQN